MSADAVTSVAFDQLFDKLGTLDLNYSETARALDGRRVEIEGYLATGHGDDRPLLLIDTAGACPDCSIPPVAAMTLVDLDKLPDDVVAGETRVALAGRLSFGFQVDAAGNGSFLRLADARVVRRSASST